MPEGPRRVGAGLGLVLGALAAAQPLAAAEGERAALGIAVWDTGISGAVSDNERLDLERDLALDSDSDLVFDFAMQRGRLGLLAEHARVRADGRNTVNRDITLGDLTLIPQEESIRSRADLDESSLSLTWRFGAAGLRVRPGVTARYIDAHVSLREGDGPGASRNIETVSELFPMAHLGMSSAVGPVLLEARGSYVEYDGDRIFDVTLAGWLQPEAIAPLRVGLGWQLRDYRIARNDEENADIRLDGAQLRFGLRW